MHLLTWRYPLFFKIGGTMKNNGILSVAGIAGFVSAVAAPIGANATPTPATFGSAAILTNRNCVTTPSGDCQLGTRNYLQYAGGAGSSFSTSATNEGNTGASGSAYSSFSANAVPTLGVASFSGASTRTGASALAYQTFTYRGASAINLALAGTLHYIGSGNLTSTGILGLEVSGSGFFGANLTVLPTSALNNIGSSGQDLISTLTEVTDCSAGARATAFSGSLGQAAGEHTIPLSLSTACDGGAITIVPGQSFVILTTVQAISNQGGFVDAMHTFSAFFDPAKTVFADTGQAVGEAFLATTIAAVPEPASWAMMVGGFGLAGGAMRLRRRRTARAQTVN